MTEEEQNTIIEHCLNGYKENQILLNDPEFKRKSQILLKYMLISDRTATSFEEMENAVKELENTFDPDPEMFSIAKKKAIDFLGLKEEEDIKQ